jgi:hypothetical protein
MRLHYTIQCALPQATVPGFQDKTTGAKLLSVETECISCAHNICWCCVASAKQLGACANTRAQQKSPPPMSHSAAFQSSITMTNSTPDSLWYTH